MAMEPLADICSVRSAALEIVKKHSDYIAALVEAQTVSSKALAAQGLILCALTAGGCWYRLAGSCTRLS